MFTENEITAMIDMPAIKDAVVQIRKEFIQKEAKYLEISEHDFLSLIMMTPTIGIALADGSISFLEEVSLNKKARRMSKGGYVFSKDPVSDAMRFLIKNFKHWEVPFYKVIKLCMDQCFSFDEVRQKHPTAEATNNIQFIQVGMRMPYILIRFIAAIFIKGESDIMSEKKVSKVEFDKINFIATHLDLSELRFYKAFINTFKVK
jgi:hypothetical protein